MRPWLCLALCCIVLAPGQAQAYAVWCAVQDGTVAYASGVQSTEASSRGALRSLSSRFVRVVNASKGTHVALDGTACRRFADRGAAARGLAAFQLRVKQTGGRVEFMGVY